MNIHELEAWVEANPGKSILIGGAGVLFLLWIFGAFSKSSSGNGQSSLASAYYAAEAQQAAVGGQIQMTTIASAADVAKTKLSTDAAVAINSSNANAAQIINGQNVGAAQTINLASINAAQAINQYNRSADVTLAGIQASTIENVASDQLQATFSNNATAVANTQITTNAALEATKAQIAGTETITALNTVVPQELAMTGGYGNFHIGSTDLSINSGSPIGDANAIANLGFDKITAKLLALLGMGYTPQGNPALFANSSA